MPHITRSLFFGTPQDFVRLQQDEWKWHLREILLHLMVPGVQLVNNLIITWIRNGDGQPITLESLAGQPITVFYDEGREELQIEWGDIFLADMKGGDG